jgi:isopentenyldiphosphate isomerase
MTKKHVYEQPRTTVCQLEEICGLLAASGSKTVTLDNKTVSEVNWESTEGNPDEIDAKENTLGTTLWND